MLHEGAKGVLLMYPDHLPCLAKHRLSTYLLIVLPGVCFSRQLLKCLLLIHTPLTPIKYPADNITLFCLSTGKHSLFSSLALPLH